MLIITCERCGEHTPPPGHPERPERADVFVSVARRWNAKGIEIAAATPVTREELSRVHSTDHLDRIAATSGRATMLDPDTFTSPESYEIAVLAAGATIQAARHATEGRGSAFALVRPPGHHAERDRTMGFCLFNNAAVAAADALARGLERIAVVDIDVHHGNGTQWIFYTNPRVLYISTHQYPFYPGTGAATETGRGDGAGYTVNIPLEAGATDADYDLVCRAIATPVLERFAPQLTIISAGYDAHEADPLAQMRMTAPGYARVVARLRLAAQKSGSLALVTEGGYDLAALRDCLDATIEVLEADTIGDLDSDISEHTPRGDRALRAARAAQAPFWPDL